MDTEQPATNDQPTTSNEQPVSSPDELRQAAIAAIKGEKPPEQPPATPAEPPKPTQPTVADEEHQRLASAYARAERELRATKAAIAEHEKTKREYDALVGRLKDPKSRYSALEEYGGNYEEWTNKLVATGDKAKDESVLRLETAERRLQQIEESLKAKELEFAQRQQSAQLEGAKQWAREYVAKNDDYALTRTLGQSDSIVAEYQRRLTENDGLLDEADVAKAVEAQLETVVKRQLGELSKLDKFNKLMSELGYTQSKLKENAKETKPTNGGAKAPTLTNDMSAEGSSDFDYLKASPDELRRRAIRMAEAARLKQSG